MTPDDDMIPSGLRRREDPKACTVCGCELTEDAALTTSAVATLALSAPSRHDPYFWRFCNDCYPRLSLSLAALLRELVRDTQGRKKRA